MRVDELHGFRRICRTSGSTTAEEIDPHTMLSNFASEELP